VRTVSSKEADETFTELPLSFFRTVVARIVDALLEAKKPLIVTSYLGRNLAAVQQLIKFVELLALPVFQSCLSYINLPFDHPSHAGMALGGKNLLVEEADCILILDSDIPW